MFMRYFTRDWATGERPPGRLNEAWEQYSRRLREIQERLPADVLRIAETWFLHDGLLRRLIVRPADQSVRMIIDTYERGPFAPVHLHYRKVERFEYYGPDDVTPWHGPGLGHLLYWEVDLVEGLFEHRLLFASAVELLIQFREFRLVEPRRRDCPLPA